MAEPQEAEWPFQYEAVMDNGIIFRTKNGAQSDARRLPRPVRELRVFTRCASIPFGISLPLGARAVIFRSGTLHVQGGVDGDSMKHDPLTYSYGWELEFEGETIRSVWEFAEGKPPVLRERA